MVDVALDLLRRRMVVFLQALFVFYDMVVGLEIAGGDMGPKMQGILAGSGEVDGQGRCSSFTECLGLANLSILKQADEDKRQAAAFFLRAAGMRPDSKQAWLGLGASLQDLRDFVGAEWALTEAMAIDPLCWRVGVNFGHLSALKGDYDLSARVFEHVIRSRPNIPQAYYSLGFLRMLHGRLREACHLFTESWGLKSDMHTLIGMDVALKGLQSLRSMGEDCTGVVPDKVSRDFGFLSGGTAWEQDYMSGNQQPCQPREIVIDASRIGLDGGQGMEDLRAAVGSLHRNYGMHCDGSVVVRVVVGEHLDSKSSSEIGAWDLVTLHRTIQDAQSHTGVVPDHHYHASIAVACKHTQGDFVLLPPGSRLGEESGIHSILAAARSQISGVVAGRLRVGVDEKGVAVAFGIVHQRGCQMHKQWPQIKDVDIEPGLYLRASDHADVVVLGLGGAARDIARILEQSRMKVVLIGADKQGSKDLASAVMDARTLVIVVEDDDTQQVLSSLVASAASSTALGLRRSAGGKLRSVFGVLVDNATAWSGLYDSMGKADWYRLASPISASISMEGDAGAPSGQDALELVNALGLLLWPAGERDRVPTHKCFLRARQFRQAPVPDKPLAAKSIGSASTRICLCAPTLSPPSVTEISELPLVGILVPSFVRTVARQGETDSNHSNFSYFIYVGYDEGDRFFDTRSSEVWEHLDEVTRGSGVVVHPFKLPPTKGGIAFIWNALMKAAYEDGCDYMYQSNDDVEMITSGWAQRFVSALESSSVAPNFGIVGALDLNNPIIMTQSFVHRTHQDILGWHFPHTIKNWHLDDWSSSVYGPEATYHLKDVHIRNTNTFGTRYTECREDERWFRNEVARCGAIIRKRRQMPVTELSNLKA